MRAVSAREGRCCVKVYQIVPMDVRETVSKMSTSQLVTAIAAHAARVEMARSAAGPMLLPYETQEAEAACIELDERLPQGAR